VIANAIAALQSALERQPVVNRVVPELIRNGRVPAPGIGIVAANEIVATNLASRG
jgi:hypothetical protein